MYREDDSASGDSGGTRKELWGISVCLSVCLSIYLCVWSEESSSSGRDSNQRSLQYEARAHIITNVGRSSPTGKAMKSRKKKAVQINPSSEAKLTVTNYWFHSRQSARALDNYSTGQGAKPDGSSSRLSSNVRLISKAVSNLQNSLLKFCTHFSSLRCTLHVP